MATTPVTIQNTTPKDNTINSIVNTNVKHIQVGNPSAAYGAQQDYVQRKGYLGSSNTRKVALVGRYSGVGIWDTTTVSGSIKPQDNIVVFPLTPQLTESGQVLKVDEGNIRRPSSIIVYIGSPSRNFSINAEFVSRTPEEAAATFKSIQILKSWRMPISNGNEPETVRLFAYDGQLKGIPCLMTNITIEWPKDVDYIVSNTPEKAEVPILQTVSVTLEEVRNYNDMAAFNYIKFKEGILDQW